MKQSLKWNLPNYNDKMPDAKVNNLDTILIFLFIWIRKHIRWRKRRKKYNKKKILKSWNHKSLSQTALNPMLAFH